MIGAMIEIGMLLPSRETAMTGEHDGSGVVAFARDAEAAGFDSVWTGDSPLARIRMDPLPLLAAAAAVTTRVSVGTAAFTAALRHPLLAAHGAATVDQVSGGRLIRAGRSGWTRRRPCGATCGPIRPPRRASPERSGTRTCPSARGCCRPRARAGPRCGWRAATRPG